jgi:proteasome accessory factor B
MERTERLLDLVALLLDAHEPISWAELRESFPHDYGSGSDEAAERKFERDKAELLELGIPITYVQGDDDRKDGYIVNREAYYLPEVGLTPEELAVLYAAGSAALASGAFPGRDDLAHALRKIGFFAGSELPTPRVRMELGAVQDQEELAPKLELLRSAALSRKWVELSYYSPASKRSTQRKVDPYALALRRGIWSLVGFCHLRQGLRTFHVHRIQQLRANPAKPKSPDFQVPADFRLDDFVAQYTWEHRFHAPMRVHLTLRGELARLADRAFPKAELETAGEVAQIWVETTYLDGLLRYVLSLGESARVLAPAEAVQRHREMALAVLQQHQPPPQAPVAAQGSSTRASEET